MARATLIKGDHRLYPPEAVLRKADTAVLQEVLTLAAVHHPHTLPRQEAVPAAVHQVRTQHRKVAAVEEAEADHFPAEEEADLLQAAAAADHLQAEEAAADADGNS